MKPNKAVKKMGGGKPIQGAPKKPHALDANYGYAQKDLEPKNKMAKLADDNKFGDLGSSGSEEHSDRSLGSNDSSEDFTDEDNYGSEDDSFVSKGSSDREEEEALSAKPKEVSAVAQPKDTKPAKIEDSKTQAKDAPKQPIKKGDEKLSEMSVAAAVAKQSKVEEAKPEKKEEKKAEGVQKPITNAPNLLSIVTEVLADFAPKIAKAIETKIGSSDSKSSSGAQKVQEKKAGVATPPQKQNEQKTQPGTPSANKQQKAVEGVSPGQKTQPGTPSANKRQKAVEGVSQGQKMGEKQTPGPGNGEKKNKKRNKRKQPGQGPQPVSN